jgi:hypothetical protein
MRKGQLQPMLLRRTIVGMRAEPMRLEKRGKYLVSLLRYAQPIAERVTDSKEPIYALSGLSRI